MMREGSQHAGLPSGGTLGMSGVKARQRPNDAPTPWYTRRANVHGNAANLASTSARPTAQIAAERTPGIDNTHVGLATAVTAARVAVHWGQHRESSGGGSPSCHCHAAAGREGRGVRGRVGALKG